MLMRSRPNAVADTWGGKVAAVQPASHQDSLLRCRQQAAATQQERCHLNMMGLIHSRRRPSGSRRPKLRV